MLIPTAPPSSLHPPCRKMSKACMSPVSRLEVSAVERSERGLVVFKKDPDMLIRNSECLR